MIAIHASQALLPSGWARNVRITVSAAGRIAETQTDVPPRPGDEGYSVVIPGLPNVHSHAFQRAMAGQAERRGPGSDSFWSWREAMYRFALSMTPAQIEAVAAQLYVEMLEAGFTRVAEFHYLHHAPDGSAYEDVGEMAARIAAAAETTGIGLTLLPVFYARSGFGGAPPHAGQRRFVSTLDGYARLLARCEELAAQVPGGCVGIAPHSLRAVTPDELDAIVGLSGTAPVHIHISEQRREVRECLAWSGQRPVAWLLANQAVDERWCLIHATHMTQEEARAVAASGAVVGLCPLTEANLGDGTFAAPAFLAEGGRIGIGTDSNILVGVADELRQLEYSQRLQRRRRNVLAAPGQSTGRALFDWVLAGGAAATRAPAGLSVGEPADFVSLRPRYDLPVASDRLLDAWIFAGGAAIDSVWVHGRQQVSGGRHRLRRQVRRAFAASMHALLS